MLKGLDKFQSKVPALRGNRVALVPIYAFTMLTVAVGVMLLFDCLPGWLPAAPPAAAFLPLAGVVIAGVIGLALVWQMWFQRERLRRRYKKEAYRRIFFVGFTGVSWLFAVAVHQFAPARALAPGFWAASPLAILATPPEAILGAAGAAVVIAVKIVLSAVLGGGGLLLFARALATFGFDYMTVVYLYFPEESKIQKNEIYSALRHPAYAAAIYIALAGTVLTGTLIALAVFVLYFLGFWIHVRFVEERELIERFGESYRAYRTAVPAFFTLKLVVLGRFLLGRGAEKERAKSGRR
jgi:protein-S-isoprenylcysteine O-methyltransferase Ste14